MRNNDCSVKLKSERSFLVKFGIFAPQINSLFYSRYQRMSKGVFGSYMHEYQFVNTLQPQRVVVQGSATAGVPCTDDQRTHGYRYGVSLSKLWQTVYTNLQQHPTEPAVPNPAVTPCWPNMSSLAGDRRTSISFHIMAI